MPIRTLDRESHFALDGELHNLLNLIINRKPYGTCASKVVSIQTSQIGKKPLCDGWDNHQEITFGRFANDRGILDKEGDALLSVYSKMACYVRSDASPFDKHENHVQLQNALLIYLSRRAGDVP